MRERGWSERDRDRERTREGGGESGREKQGERERWRGMRERERLREKRRGREREGEKNRGRGREVKRVKGGEREALVCTHARGGPCCYTRKSNSTSSPQTAYRKAFAANAIRFRLGDLQFPNSCLYRLNRFTACTVFPQSRKVQVAKSKFDNIPHTYRTRCTT